MAVFKWLQYRLFVGAEKCPCVSTTTFKPLFHVGFTPPPTPPQGIGEGRFWRSYKPGWGQINVG